MFYLTKDVTQLTEKTGKIALYKSEKSSNIFGIGYRNGFLYALFNTGTIYSYKDVPVQTVFDLIKIIHEGEKESLGKRFNLLIKKAGYEYKRVSKENV